MLAGLLSLGTTQTQEMCHGPGPSCKDKRNAPDTRLHPLHIPIGPIGKPCVDLPESVFIAGLASHDDDSGAKASSGH